MSEDSQMQENSQNDPQLENHRINTKGGSYIEGSVQIAKGNFIGRDNYSIIIHPSQTGIPVKIPLPPFPNNFVPRPELSEPIIEQLAAEDTGMVSTIQGMAGIGKSVLAASIIYEKSVQERFEDGIFWVTLSQQPDIRSSLSGLLATLGGDALRQGVGLDVMKNSLSSILSNKACLIVIDDAWQPEHVQYFLVGGSRCKVLITTRDALITRTIEGATLHYINIMTSDQALSLIEGRLKRELLENEIINAERLSRITSFLQQ
jgi:hypothetical protein